MKVPFGLSLKTVTIIMISGLALMTLLVLVFNRSTPELNTDTTQTPVVSQPNPSPEASFRPIPADIEKINDAGISTQNLYKNNPPPDLRSDTTFATNDRFSLIYLAENNEFLIGISAEPFETNRTEAEQRLLSELKINQQQACNLKVSIVNKTVPQRPVVNKLSFCP